MIEAVREMAAAGDRDALRDMWELLGGTGSRFLGSDPTAEDLDQAAEQVTLLLQGLFPGKQRDPFAAQRAALAEVAEAFDVDSSTHARTADLEDAIYEAIGQRLESRLAGMSDAKREHFIGQALKRWTEEERLRLIEGVADGYDNMDVEAQAALATSLAAELDSTETEIREALKGGASALLPLLMAREQGFALYLGSTQLIHSVLTTGLGLKAPFAVYMLKNRALGWLLGPVGLLVTTGASAGWWAYKARRHSQRMRKLIQVIAYTSAWRKPA